MGERDRSDSDLWPFYPKDSSKEFVFHNPKTFARRPGDTITDSSAEMDRSPGLNDPDSDSDQSDDTRSSIDDDDMYTVTSNPQVRSHSMLQPASVLSTL